jgi:hypothetical protein
MSNITNVHIHQASSECANIAVLVLVLWRVYCVVLCCVPWGLQILLNRVAVRWNRVTWTRGENGLRMAWKQHAWEGTPWCRVHPGKLTGSQLTEKFPAFYGNTEVHYRIHKSSPPVSILSQINLVWRGDKHRNLNPLARAHVRPIHLGFVGDEEAHLRPVHAEFMVKKKAHVGTVHVGFVRGKREKAFLFSPVSVFPPLLHTRIQIIHCQRCIILAIDSFVK